MLTLLALAGALRAVGAVARSRGGPARVLAGWLFCITATWTAAGVAGVWLPLWSVVPVAAAGGLLELRTGRAGWLAGGDLALLAAMAAWATPPAPWSALLLLAGGLAVLWGAVEAWARWAPRPLRAATPVLGLAAVLLLGLRLYDGGDPLQPFSRILPAFAIAAGCQGERVDLESGGVAWYKAPRGSPPHPGAVVLHGADPRGSRQPSACSLRRALATAGFATMAVDHPGYGASPSPGVNDGPDAWDPRPTEAQAYDSLEARPEVESVKALAGHSMGGTGALRLLGKRPATPLVFLFGVALGEGSERDDYWHERFHEDRGLEDRMPVERWREIQDVHYDLERIAAEEVPAGTAHMVFATFEWEWENVKEGRDGAYEAIPGSKERWHLSNASHYFSAFRWYGLTAGNSSVARAVAAGIRKRAEDR